MHRILPPPLVVAVLAGVMWFIGQAGAMTLSTFPGQTLLVLFVAGAGLGVMFLAVWQFRRGGTTVNPMAPDEASSLVDQGVYRYSRNPMYLGDLLLLTAWAVYLGAAVNLLLLPLFVWYINRFQILPEEQALSEHFGNAFRDYCARAPRWFSLRALFPRGPG